MYTNHLIDALTVKQNILKFTSLVFEQEYLF